MGGEAGSSQAGAGGVCVKRSVKIDADILKQRGYGKDTVRPVTIKQVLDAQQPHPDADFKIDGDAISQVRPHLTPT
jgi:hypothetical protein